jgi:V/A-type H+/Na+-transporting ATPase subunit F
MNYYVIGGEDVVLGFGYADVAGKVVTTPEETKAALAEACANEKIQVVIIEDLAASSIRAEVDRVRFTAHRPVVVEVPGPKGPDPNRADLMKLIREAVGIKL